MNKGLKKSTILTVSFLFLALVIIFAGSSYALLTQSVTSNKTYSMTVSGLDFEITNETNMVNISNAYPMTDKQGLKTEPFTFSLKNNGEIPIAYTIRLNQDTSDTTKQHLSSSVVKFQITEGNNTIGPKLLSEVDNKLISGTIYGKDTVKNFELKLWLDLDATIEEEGKIYSAKIEVMGTQVVNNLYVDNILNGADPVLNDGLIPVTIENDGTVKKADIRTEWYNYTEKMWANAVILTDDTEYEDGEVIPETNIESYFVWVPKYSYKLWNVNVTDPLELAHSIDIVFGLDNTTDTSTSCVTPLTSGASGTCQNGMYMTHPAFITMDVNGIWVGKFETGYKGATSAAAAQVSSADSTKIIVKPNVYSWRGNTVENFFTAAYNFNRELDSHMMKNTEWGAVAYLSHSKFGIDKEININNNNAYKTGYSAKLSTQQGTYPGESGDGGNYNVQYNTTIGYLASTTGNISGIYDMAGGTNEYMASYRSGASVPQGDAKYFDVYSSSSSQTTYNYRILGDATGEMGPIINYKDGDGGARWHNKWYGDASVFVNSTYPWFVRGGNYGDGVLAGQFYFGISSGVAHGSIGSRLVLAPKEIVEEE